MPDEEVIEEEVVEETKDEKEESTDSSTDESGEGEPQTIHDEKTAFGGDDKKDDTDIFEEEEEPEAEEKDDKKSGDHLGDDDEKEPDEEEEKEGKEEGAEEEEEDEDVKRGKELIDAEKVAAEEQKVKDDAQKVEDEKADAYNPFTATIKPEDIQRFSIAVPKNFLPPQMTLADGTELDFAGRLEEDPEFVPMTIALITNAVDQLIANGHLIHASQAKTDMDDVYSSIDDKLFLRTVTNKRHGVPDAVEIHKSDGFKDWFKDQSAEIQALDKSDKPGDHIRLFKRYLGQAGLDDAKKKTADHDKKRKKAKKTFDDIHKTTAKSKQTRPGKSAQSGDAREEEGFTSKDTDEDQDFM